MMKHARAARLIAEKANKANGVMDKARNLAEAVSRRVMEAAHCGYMSLPVDAGDEATRGAFAELASNAGYEVEYDRSDAQRVHIHW